MPVSPPPPAVFSTLHSPPHPPPLPYLWLHHRRGWPSISTPASLVTIQPRRPRTRAVCSWVTQGGIHPRTVGLQAMASPQKEQESSTTTISTQDPASDQGERLHLSIDFPAGSMPDHLLTPTPAGADSTPTPGSNTNRGPNLPMAPGSSSSRSSAPPKPQRSRSFVLRQTVKSLLPGGSFKQSVKGYETSFSRFFNTKFARTSSLPSDDVSGADALSHEVDKASSSCATDKTGRMHRSQSLPMNMKKFNVKSFKRMNSLGGVYRVVPSTPRVPATSNHITPDVVPTESGIGEDIPEEEAVCRICMVELSEGSNTLKLECCCKGELALAHKDCALKWFSMKGTRTCEVCKEEVQNLPVTLVRVRSMQGETSRAGNVANRSRYDRYRMWHGTPILLIVSILAYFCFLEQLLVARHGIAALAISLPFSCTLGLFSSMTTASMVARRYVWVYAAVQFLLVVFFTHFFYRYLHLQAVISIILATFAGFGLGMTGNSIIVKILRLRARRLAPPAEPRHGRRTRVAQQQVPASGQPSSQPSAADEGQRNAGVDVENPAVP